MKERNYKYGGDKFVRPQELCEILGGISTSTLNRWRKETDFPQPSYLGPRPAWLLSEVIDWAKARKPQ